VIHLPNADHDATDALRRARLQLDGMDLEAPLGGR
jgi:hypothetical protein